MLELSAIEARVLGALVEKSKTTPDYYPLTLNALTAACNQSSNRDPVTSYTEEQVEAAMRDLRERKLARSVRTSRSRIMKHQHDLEQALVLDGAAVSVLAVLLLRGPQTVGELRTRTERYHDFAGLDEVEATLTSLAADDPPLVRRLDRQPGQKEARWTHLLSGAEPDAPPVAAAPDPAPIEVDAAPWEARLAALERRVAELEQQLGLAD